MELVGQFPTKVVEQNFLVVGGLCDTSGADRLTVAGVEYNIDCAEFTEFGQHPSWLITETSFGAELAQELPQHIRQEADQDVRQHAILFLMPHRTQG